MKKITIILLFYFSFTFLFSQNETSQWYFGINTGLNFLTNPPSLINTSAMPSYEGCASISDANGNLLFYTEGVTVWNSANVQMANGFGLLGSNSSTQSSIIIKKPGSQSLYYLFTQGQVGLGPLAYSIIDMSLAAGMGSVTVKNVTLCINTAEKLCATKHCNGTDYWILTHTMNTNNFLAYHLSSSGVNTVAVVSAIGAAHSSGTSGVGYMKFSPNGRKLGVAQFGDNNGLELFDFNPTSGMVTNLLNLGANNSAYGCEFSPDGTKFYASTLDLLSSPIMSHLIQWDLCAGSSSAVISSRFAVASEPSPYWLAGMQLGSDGKLYVARDSQQNLGVIQNPNLVGSACNYTSLGPSSGAVAGMDGLPNFVSNYFREKPVFTATVTCASAAFSLPLFCAAVGYSITGQSWTFGDPASGAANSTSITNPSHIYSGSGTYTAQLILNYDCSSDTLKQIVNITVPAMNVVGKTTICSKESTTLSVSGANTYTWSNGLNTTTVGFTPTTTTTYTVSGTFTNTLCNRTKVVTVSVIPCTGIYEAQEQEKLVALYPNPNKGLFTLESLYANTHLIIYNQFGNKVYETFLNTPTQKIDVSDLPAGVYFITALSNGKSASLKFVKSE